MYGGQPQRPPPQLQSRRIVDPTGTSVRYLKDRIFRPEAKDSPAPIQCTAGKQPGDAASGGVVAASTSICRGSCLLLCKDRCSINAVIWTPEGRRLLAGGSNGMFTLWSSVDFMFETTQQAHEARWSGRTQKVDGIGRP